MTGIVQAELIGHWRLDEGTGGQVVDATGRGHDGTINGATWSSPGSNGKRTCLLFDGSNDVVVVPHADDLRFGANAAYTIAAWVNMTIRPGHWSGIITKGRDTGNWYGIWVNDGNLWCFGHQPSNQLGSEVEPGVWVHVVMAYNNGNKRIYLDGMLDSEATASASGDNTSELWFGAAKGVTEFAPARIDDIRIYDHAVTDAEIQKIMKGTADAPIAYDPEPEDGGQDTPRDVVLGWAPGEFAATHDVYLGTSFDDVNDATQPVASVTEVAYDPEGLLDYGQTYYWRVDEVNGAPDFTVVKGEVWSFTTEMYAYPITSVTATDSAHQPASPASMTVNRSGLDDLDQHGVDLKTMWVTPGGLPAWIQFCFDKVYKLHELWVWNANSELEVFMGFGVKDVTIEYSTDGETWTALESVPQFAQGNAKVTYTANNIIDLGGVLAKCVRLTVNTTWGATGIASLSEVRFFYAPVQAFEPVPADDATGVSINATLNWRPGREATSHEVYLGTDAAAVADGTVSGHAVTDHSYAPEELMLATEYFWKVDELGDSGTYAGDVWTFTTEEYTVVDDFESYTDDMDAEEAVFQTWIDGYGVDTNGSLVGIDPAVGGTFCESTIVHGGSQSMPIFYDNSGGATHAEAKRTFDDAQNWNASGIQGLSLWFRGATGNTGTLYVKINNTKVPYDGPATDIGIAGWQRWSIVLAGTGANLSNVTALTVGIEGAGATGVLYVDDIRLVPAVLETEDIGIDIAISTRAGWFGQAAADREMQEIVDNVPARIKVFTMNDLDGLADWVAAHTGDGASDLLILCGQFPNTIYGGANAQPDGSLAELFLDDGNTIINTGDYLFYVNTAGSNNAEAGIQNMMDIPAITMWDDDTAVTVTADGQTVTPALQDFATDRPFHLDELAGDWVAELVLAQNAAGTRADPVIVRNSVTGGRLGIFYQTNSQDNDPRGEVISEWINNWYLDAVSGGN